MKIIVNGTELSQAVMKVSKAISVKTTNPILEGIKLSVEGDNLTLSATDMEIAIEKTISSDTFMPVAYNTSSIALSRIPFVLDLSGHLKSLSTSLVDNICGNFFSAFGVFNL